MKTTENLIVCGIKPSKGSFENDKGATVNYDSTNFHCQVPFKSDSGGVGCQEVVHKLPAAANFERFKNIELPSNLEFTFEVEMAGKFPKFKLVNVQELHA